MSIYELACQYRVSAGLLKARIHNLSPTLKDKNGSELILEKRRIYSLYADAAECLRCAKKLENYYMEGYHGQNNIQS